MNCSLQGCLGQYEAKRVIHTVRHRGRVVVIDHVPADVCSICGDVLFKPETVRAIERLLGEVRQPDASVPLYEYA
ncbi:MAG: type II toxin-antitoxin system MqsA family antitoxin [Candidatus Solibacter usitatus]|nr:type II toxin-antitoxin system MqsA family antitoxin [Candidatus Solibacter usitatus]